MMKMCLDRTVFVQFIGRKTRRTHNNTHTRHTTRSLVTTAKRPLTKRRAKSSRLGAALFTFSRQEALKYTTRQTKKKELHFILPLGGFSEYIIIRVVPSIQRPIRGTTSKRRRKKIPFLLFIILFFNLNFICERRFMTAMIIRTCVDIIVFTKKSRIGRPTIMKKYMKLGD